MTTTDKDIFTEIGNVIKRCRLPFEVVGVVAFGSRAKGKETIQSDFDLLVIAEGIHPQLHRRKAEIFHVKHCLTPLPFDILLFTPREAISNFENHNPLFLDIAEDGIILLDRNNILKALIDNTKKYIKERGIRRLEGGWEFPVKQGVATYLSRISNQDFARAMLKDGERDLLIAQKLGGEGFHDKSVYHSQQAIEKCVKAVLIAFGIFQKTHFIGGILKKILGERDLAEEWKKKLTGIAEISEEIEPDVSLSRYPGIIDDALWLPFDEYEKMDSEAAAENAGKVLAVAKEFLNYWFSETANENNR